MVGISSLELSSESGHSNKLTAKPFPGARLRVPKAGLIPCALVSRSAMGDNGFVLQTMSSLGMPSDMRAASGTALLSYESVQNGAATAHVCLCVCVCVCVCICVYVCLCV